MEKTQIIKANKKNVFKTLYKRLESLSNHFPENCFQNNIVSLIRLKPPRQTQTAIRSGAGAWQVHRDAIRSGAGAWQVLRDAIRSGAGALQVH